MSKENPLRKLFLFSHLSPPEVKLIDELIVERTYKKGSLIITEGDPGEALFVLRSGRVKIFKTSPEGGEQILTILGEGAVFAEVVLFDGGSYPASAEALTDSVIGMLHNRDMEGMLTKHPEIAVKMLRLLSARLRRAQNQVGDLALKDVYGRMAGLLLRMAQRQGEEGPEGIVINLAFTRQEMANMVGATRETVARVLSHFKKEGAISIDKQKITLLSKDKLTEWLK